MVMSALSNRGQCLSGPEDPRSERIVCCQLLLETQKTKGRWDPASFSSASTGVTLKVRRSIQILARSHQTQDAYQQRRPQDFKSQPCADHCQLIAIASLLSTAAFAVTPPRSCPFKVFVDAYPNPGCATVNSGVVPINLTEGLYLAPGECKDTTGPVLSFRNAGIDDAKVGKCTLTVCLGTGCKGSEFSTTLNKEAAED